MIRNLFILFFLFSILIGQKSPLDSLNVKNPSLAWRLSLFPGMGQIYNEKYIKSALFISLGTYAFLKRKDFSKIGEIGKRNTYTWWLFGLYILGILDAYVDAHLSTFPDDKLKLDKDKD